MKSMIAFEWEWWHLVARYGIQILFFILLGPEKTETSGDTTTTVI